MGEIRKRCGIWWVRYVNDGHWCEESSHSTERRIAEQLLQTREVAALNAMCGTAGAGHRPNILIAPDGRTPGIALNPRQTAALLTAVCAFVRRYVVLSDDQAVAATLWAAHTHAIEAADCTPYLHVTAATKRAGKTRLLDVLEPLVPRPWRTDRVSAAVLVRKIDAEHSTLLLDESDAALTTGTAYAETLRGVLNSGYRRSGKVSLCAGGSGYRDFATFAARPLPGGQLPDTVADRSIPIRLQRRMVSEPVARWRDRESQAAAAPLATRLAQWARMAVPKLRIARPKLPAALDDRAADVWEPLLAIADRAGDEWPARARQSAEALSGRHEDPDPLVQLLGDIRAVLDQEHGAVIPTNVLLDRLVDAEDRPWSEWRRGHPLTARGLACLLGPLGVHPDRCDTPNGRCRGYRREAFQDAVARYLPHEASR